VVFLVLDFHVFEFGVHAQGKIAWQCPGRCSPGKEGVAEFVALVVDGVKGDSHCGVLDIFVVLTCLEIRQGRAAGSRVGHDLFKKINFIFFLGVSSE